MLSAKPACCLLVAGPASFAKHSRIVCRVCLCLCLCLVVVFVDLQSLRCCKCLCCFVLPSLLSV